MVRRCRLKQELEIKSYHLDLLNQQAQGSRRAQLAKAIESAEADLAEAEQALQDAHKRAKAMAALQKACITRNLMANRHKAQ